MQTFRSKIDFWLIIIILVTFVFPVFLTWGQGDAFRTAIIIGAILWALLFWLMFMTRYVVNEDELIIHGGIYKVRIPLNEIKSVESSNSVLAGPALSRDRLQIIYGDYKNILVSPKDKTGFLAAIGQS